VVEPEDGVRPLLDLTASAREALLGSRNLRANSLNANRDFFAVARPEDLPPLVLAFERLDLEGPNP